MIPDFRLCDKCKAQTDKQLSLFIFRGRQPDGAGGMEDTGDLVDLCNRCAVEALKVCLKSQPELGETVMKFVTKKEKPHA